MCLEIWSCTRIAVYYFSRWYFSLPLLLRFYFCLASHTDGHQLNMCFNVRGFFITSAILNPKEPRTTTPATWRSVTIAQRKIISPLMFVRVKAECSTWFSTSHLLFCVPQNFQLDFSSMPLDQERVNCWGGKYKNTTLLYHITLLCLCCIV